MHTNYSCFRFFVGNYEWFSGIVFWEKVKKFHGEMPPKMWLVSIKTFLDNVLPLRPASDD